MFEKQIKNKFLAKAINNTYGTILKEKGLYLVHLDDKHIAFEGPGLIYSKESGIFSLEWLKKHDQAVMDLVGQYLTSLPPLDYVKEDVIRRIDKFKATQTTIKESEPIYIDAYLYEEVIKENLELKRENEELRKKLSKK